MSRKHFTKPIPCRAFIEGKDEHAQFEIMRNKRTEEERELQGAIVAYEKLETQNKLTLGKAREHILEEGVDLIVATYTSLCTFATEEEISEEIRKVNIKNKLRGYHHLDPSEEEIPF